MTRRKALAPATHHSGKGRAFKRCGRRNGAKANTAATNPQLAVSDGATGRRAREEVMTKQDDAQPVQLQKNRVEYNFGLVGRCFHTLNDEGGVVQQGIIKSIVGDDKALVQYLEWTIGEPGVLKSCASMTWPRTQTKTV